MYNDSTSIDGKVSSTHAALINAISKMPAEWALTPCVGKKNLWPNWNKAKLDRSQLIEAIRSQKNHEGKKTAWTGVSIVTGPLSGGIMAIDFDGSLALTKYFELSGGVPAPATKRWTSGRSGHFQILLQVPKDKWEGLQPKKIELENGEKLELRWNQCSTLPPSIHPDTQQPYIWKNTGEIAEAPEFVLDLMREAPAVELPKESARQNTIYIDVEKSLVDILENEVLPRLDAEEFYGSYLKLKSAGKNLKALCPFHDEKTPSFSVTPQEKTFHCFGCGVGGGPVQFLHQIKGGSGSPTGKEFAEVVRELAGKVGVQMPDRKQPSGTRNPLPNTQSPKSNVITHPKFETPDAASLEPEIEKLFELDLKRSQIQIRISELAKIYRLSSSDIWKIYREQEQEQEQEADRPDVATEIESLLSAHKTSIKLTEVLPVGLAQPIEKLATILNLRSECYLAALLTQVASLFKVGTETILRRDSDWRCVPNYFAGIVAEVSQLKTPIPKAIIDRPMRVLRERAQKEFEQAQLNYETELNNWKASKKEEDRGPEPKPPKIRVYIFDKTTGEAIIYQQAEFPEQAMMFFCDELAGMLKSANQYRGGKGSDEEDMLSFWNGTGATVLRASGVRASVEAVGLSVFGTIQPDVLASLLKDCSDSNGKFARFDFVFQPLAVPNLPEDDSGRFDLTPMLSDLYQKIDALPAICFEFDKQAKEYHRAFTLASHRRRMVEPKQGIRGALGKMPEKVGKLATVIHTLHCIFNGQQVTNHIPRSAVEAAVRFVKFAADQVASLYTEFSDRTALAPNLTKILLAAERKGGKISLRDAQLAFNGKNRPTAQVVRLWFGELVALGYGVSKKSGKSLIFQNTRGTVEQFLQSPSNSISARVTATDPSSIGVEQFHELFPLKPAQHKGSGSIVGTVPPIDRFEKKAPTDEDAKENLSKKHAEAVTVPTIPPQTPSPLSFEVDQFAPTVGDSSYSGLNENEADLLGMIRAVVSENHAYTAHQIRDILKSECEAGHADRKKVWGALTDAEQKKFTQLVQVEIPAEVGHVIESMQIILHSSDDPNEIDHLFRVFPAEVIDRAIAFLRADDKQKILHWIAIRDLAAGLIEAIADGPEAIQKIATQYSPEVVREAIARIKTKDPDAAEEIRDAIEVSSSTQMPEKVPSQQEVQTPSSETVVTAEEFAEQIRKAIANVDRSLAIQVWDELKAKAKRK
ncbi:MULTISPECIES: DUF3987 domain-containing protein, partial [unclassified Microcoleus]